MEFLRTNGNLGTKTKLSAVIETCGSVDKYSSTVDLIDEALSMIPYFCQDCI